MTSSLSADDRRLYKLFADFIGEANEVGGSEGLYQSLFYSHARKYFPASCIRREEKVQSGYIDFVIESKSNRYALELKGGANGHRNSLSKMKEVEKTGKGLSHDLIKLSEYRSLASDQPTRTFLLCIDLVALGIAFSASDLKTYAEMAASANSEMVYFAQTEPTFRVFTGNQIFKISRSKATPELRHPPARKLLSAEAFWQRYFDEVRHSEGLECLHVGIFYHHLRKSGLKINQCASEVFFNCNKYNTRSYHRPDFAVFEDGCLGQFQLFGDSRKKIENDQFKLPYLVSILEFKGGAGFERKTASSKIDDISKDLHKLAEQMPPLIETASRSMTDSETFVGCSYIVVVTDPDPSLAEFISTQKINYAGTVQIQWAGNYAQV